MDNSLSLADCAEDFDVSDDPATSSSINTRHYQRLQRTEDAWAKLRQAALSTTFQKEGLFLNSNRCHFCDSKGDICCCLDWKKTVIVKNNSIIINGQTTNSQPTVGQYYCRSIVGRRSTISRPTVSWLLVANCWSTVGWRSKCRSTVHAMGMKFMNLIVNSLNSLFFGYLVFIVFSDFNVVLTGKRIIIYICDCLRSLIWLTAMLLNNYCTLIYVAVNFLFQLIFVFPLFSLCFTQKPWKNEN